MYYLFSAGSTCIEGETWWVSAERTCKAMEKSQNNGSAAFTFLSSLGLLLHSKASSSYIKWSWSLLLPWSGKHQTIFCVELSLFIPSLFLMFMLRVFFINDWTSDDNILALSDSKSHNLYWSFSCVLQVYQEIKHNVRDAVITLVRFVLPWNAKNFL